MKKAGDLLRATRSSSFFFSDRKLGSVMEDASQRYSYEPFLRWNPLVEQYFCKAYGPRNFARISKALTRPSCYSCIRVNSLKSSTDAVIEKLLAILKEKEVEYGNDFNEDSDMGTGNCSFSTESKEPQNLDVCCTPASGAVEDVTNMFNGSFGSGPISKCQFPGLDYVLFVKGSGPHTIDYGFADGKPPKEVIVSRKCAEAVLRGAQVYVPGVMACSAHVERGDLVAVSVAVEQPSVDGGWAKGITRGTIMQGLSTDPYYSERRGLYIGQGKTMLSRSGIFRVSEGVAVDMCNRVFKLPSLHDVLDGEIFLQNLPSIVAAHALDPKKGERILDMCAAPGGKTTAIAILMRDEGEIIAADRSHNKVLDIQKLAAEMGLSCIRTYKLDALKAVRRRSEGDDTTNLACSKDNYDVTVQSSDSVKLHVEKKAPITLEGLNADETLKKNVSNEKANERTYISKADIRKNLRRMRNGPGRNQCTGGRVANSKGFPPNSFDRVLLDAPCSALGLRPRLFAAEETIESLRNHAKYQRRMFDQAVQLVRPGGVIVYSTCTINPGENEALVRYALDTYKFLSLATQHPRIGGPGLLGHFEYPDGYVEEWLRPGEEELVQRFDPSSPLDTIGFFIAKFSVGLKET
ncbi:Putative methyltransferase NSUN6 [Morus notabilis]|uniref:Putative methyltransferase NSUN6 n=1 Tax=Morus notabilis TaxID=981085 RepID=W9QZS4_9ROSA|nr:putative methyltransferase NSUN6 [Morus notabilis]EXB30300.1 Putative methyltransferase NSUN6 [Morus notabilis]